MTEHPAAPTTPEEWLRRLIGPSEPDGLGDENQHWRNHPEWPDDEGMLLGCTVGDLRQIAALIEAEARSTPAEALRIRTALERLLSVAMTEEEDVSAATQDEWIAAIKQANDALDGSTPAEALPSEAEFWKAAGEWQKAGSGMTSEQETGAAMVWSWLDSHGRSTPTEALDEDDDGPVGPVRITSANCFAGDHDECAGMVEQDAPELGITDCLCPHHFPARSTPAEALDTLRQIANAKRRVSDCPTPGRCMYPQHHADDESHAEFADRLQRLALSRLSPHNREAGER